MAKGNGHLVRLHGSRVAIVSKTSTRKYASGQGTAEGEVNPKFNYFPEVCVEIIVDIIFKCVIDALAVCHAPTRTRPPPQYHIMFLAPCGHQPVKLGHIGGYVRGTETGAIQAERTATGLTLHRAVQVICN